MDISELILADHERQRRAFAVLDEARAASASTDVLGDLWQGLSGFLELHADAEERYFYPRLLDVGVAAEDETDDAIGDHNEIRDAVSRAAGLEVGSDDWWDAVAAARTANSDHMGEEERGALADFRRHAPLAARHELGLAFAAYEGAHAGARDIDHEDKDPDRYIAAHR